MLIPCPIETWAQKTPDSPAIIADDVTLTYQNLHQKVSQTSFPKANTIGLKTTNSWQEIVIFLSLLRSKITSVFLDPAKPNLLHIPIILQDEDIRKYVSQGGTENQHHPLSTDQLATGILTSGSIQPKLAFHTFGNHYYSALGSATNIPIGPGDQWRLNLPMWHVSGLSILFRCFLSGATVVLTNKPTTPCTHLSVVSSQLFTLASAPKETLQNLKAVLIGGSAISQSLMQKATEANIPFYKTYGSTEMASQITTTSLKQISDGKILPYREIKIDKNGQILVRGETLFKGYQDGPFITLPLTYDGWFETGDLGRMDEDGSLWVTGRKDLMMVSGGENIYPEEIERILQKFPEVLQAIVVPIPHPKYGQRPIAFLKMIPGTSLPSEREIRSFVQDRLPKFKVPDHFWLWPESIPLSKESRQRLVLHATP